ncbi:MAG: hypothetical protein J7M18_08555 [Candidatus Eremiobacteraeota bacterium]|nr:hypothetical protein [Candidatus Eremiobacteraeota bacterium]
MKKIVKLLAFFILVFLLISVSPGFGASETESLNNKDAVFISKITPRTSSILIPPARFPFYLEIEYNLVSLPKAYIEVGVYKKDLKKAAESESITRPRIFPITAGKGALLVTTDIISIEPQKVNQEVTVIASLKDNTDKELAYSTSRNIVAGKRKVIKSSSRSNADFFQVLGVRPPENSVLPLGKPVNFIFKVNYGVLSRPYAYANFEFADVSQVGTGMAWYIIVVPLEKGRGLMEITVPMTLPESLKGRRMGIGVPFRVEPLGGCTSFTALQSYTFSTSK